MAWIFWSSGGLFMVSMVRLDGETRRTGLSLYLLFCPPTPSHRNEQNPVPARVSGVDAAVGADYDWANGSV